MKVQESIESKLKNEFKPIHLEVHNESHMHNVPKNSETHFKVLIVSEAFAGLNRVKRQQAVYKLLKEELNDTVHALSQRALTPEEWEKMDPEGFKSPNCLGGNKL